MPALGGLKARNARRGVVSGGVDNGVFGEDGYTAIVSGGPGDRVVSAAMSGLTDGAGTWNIGSETGLVSTVEGVCGVGGDGLPSWVGMSGLLQGDNGCIVVCP